MKKTGMVCLPDGEFYVMLALSTEYQRVTDGRTDRQTSCHSIVRVMHLHHVVKMKKK